jgi:carboxypeptidase D
LNAKKNSVVKALHATAKDTAWTECSGLVGSAMHNHRSESSVQFLPGLAEKIPIMLFAGDQDVICNYVGQERLLEKLTWNGKTGMGVSVNLT